MEPEAHDSADAARKLHNSHHRNQMPTFCYCGRCLGRVKQKPRTVDDHRTRYPREPSNSPELEVPEAYLPNEIDAQDAEHVREAADLGPRLAMSSPEPYNNQLEPDFEMDALDEPGVEFEFPAHSPSDNGSIFSLESARRPDRVRNPDEAERDEPLDVAPEIDRDYAFDELFQPLANEYDFYQPGNGLDNQFGADNNQHNDNAEYDADFGLPIGENEPRDNGGGFQFEFNEDAEPIQDDDSDVEEHQMAQSAAFQEPDLIRNAYIDAFVQKHLYGATHRALKHQLKAAKRTISAHPDIHVEDIAKMAQTISTAEKRLGFNTSAILTTFTLCPICSRRYSPSYIEETESDTCLNEGCSGVLFTIRKLASGKRRRVSHTTYPFASPIAWIQHLLTLPGISELMQHWRTGDDDTEELTAPVTSDEWMRNLDPHKPMGDMCDGWGWQELKAGLERHADPQTGEVIDESPLNPPVRFASLPFGLSLTLNTDWFQATKEGNYSIGACYLVVNNLPRHMRFLRENISLSILMPGPHEPNDYALDQMLTPLVDELLQLKQGVRMVVRRGNPPVYQEEIVHSELSQHIADVIARIKMGGGAGLKSELNFCLYCHMRLSSLSAPAGYCRHEFNFRDPQEQLNNAYYWRSLRNLEERKAFFDQTGNRFTALHRIPAWHTSTSSPPDTMHLLYLGATNWIVKQVLVAPGMLTKRRPRDESPQDIFNDCLDRMWMPKNFQRLPPKLGQSQGTIKADQWKLTSRILFIPLFLAFRDGDEIGPGYVPCGNQSSPAAKNQTYRAKLLHQQRRKYFLALGEPDQCPPIEQCYASRSLRFHYRQILRFCVATSTIDKRSITPAEIGLAQQLLELLCTDYARNNVQLPPNFHYLMHLEEFMLKYGSSYNTHVWGMERANGIVSKINHNGRKNGILENTLMQGWWSHIAIQNLIRTLSALPNRSAADESVIQDLLVVLRGGAEHAQQRGSLMAFVAQCQTAYTRLHGIQDSTRLSTQLRVIDLEKHGIYELVLDFCISVWPNAGVFGPGMPRQRYLAPKGMVRNHSYVEHDGIQYGAWEHTSGKGYCYCYINGRFPVRVDRILHIEIPGEPNMRCICALVRGFCPPPLEGRFPWDTWAGHLGTSSWAYNELADLTAIPVHHFSGALALFDIPMSYRRFWVTVSMDSIRPERDYHDDDE